MSDAARVTDEAPTPAERPEAPQPPPRLTRTKQSVSLPRAQAIVGLLAAVLSISGSVYGYIRVTSRLSDRGELVAHVRDGRTLRVVPNAMVEVLRNDAIVTAFDSSDSGTASRGLKEGTYRVRVVHPRYLTEMRTVQLLAGQTSDIHFRLLPRTGPTPPPTAAPAKKDSVFKRLLD